MSAQIADVLDRAADLIEPEGAWTQGVSARDADGRACDNSLAPTAVCWCAVGAIGTAVASLHAYDPSPYKVEGAATAALARVASSASVIIWNDAEYRTQAEVVAALREAARRERVAS